MQTPQKRPRGRKKGSGRFQCRTTVGMSTEMLESIQALALEKKQSRAETMRLLLDKGFEARRLTRDQILVTLAASDMEDLQRAVKRGRVNSVEFAVIEAVRTYLREWLPKYLETKERTFGNV